MSHHCGIKFDCSCGQTSLDPRKTTGNTGGVSCESRIMGNTSHFDPAFILFHFHLMLEVMRCLITVGEVCCNTRYDFHCLWVEKSESDKFYYNKKRCTSMKAPILGNVFEPSIISFIIKLRPWHGSGQLRIQGHLDTISSQDFFTLPIVSETTIENRLAVIWTIT